MQSAGEPDDLHTILGRFSRWTGTQTGKQMGKPGGIGKAGSLEQLGEGVRELSYEEAIQRFRGRQARGVLRAAEAGPLNSAVPPHDAAVAAQIGGGPVETAGAQESLETVPAKRTPAKQKVRLKSKPAESTKQTAEIKAIPTGTGKKKVEVRKARRAARGKQAARGATDARAKTPEFRSVLAESLRAENPAAIPEKAQRAERSQRVSVRLSSKEELLLQQCAAVAGVTVSEYLRMRALDGQRAAPAAERKPSIFAPAEIPRVHDAAAPAAAPTPRSGFGEWISLLRNRFLSSPGRFAERA